MHSPVVQNRSLAIDRAKAQPAAAAGAGSRHIDQSCRAEAGDHNIMVTRPLTSGPGQWSEKCKLVDIAWEEECANMTRHGIVSQFKLNCFFANNTVTLVDK